jgi:hypothetical protein
MKSSVTLASVLLAAAFNLPSASLAQATMTPQEDYAKRLRAAELVSPLTSDLFGDSVGLFNGATEFAVVDIDLPGNGGLPVQLRRRVKVESRKELSFLGGFGIWDIDVPYLHGVFDLTFKWNQGGNGAANRCSQLWYPKVNLPLNLREIWSGTQMHIPGEGDRELLHLQTTTHPVPTMGRIPGRRAMAIVCAASRRQPMVTRARDSSPSIRTARSTRSTSASSASRTPS